MTSGANTSAMVYNAGSAGGISLPVSIAVALFFPVTG